MSTNRQLATQAQAAVWTVVKYRALCNLSRTGNRCGWECEEFKRKAAVDKFLAHVRRRHVEVVRV